LPYRRFGNADGIDPTAQTEDLGSDPVAATGYGLKNLARIADKLLASTTREGEDYETLQEIYLQVIAQRNRELGHVVGVIGGVERTSRVAGQSGPVYEPLSRDRQREAMAFLVKEGFRTPVEIIKPDLLALFEPTGVPERVLQGHRMLLAGVLNNDRMARLVNQEALAAGKKPVYRLSEMLTDLRKGIWSELALGRVDADVYRRNLQRAYLDVMNLKLNPPPAATTVPAGLPPGLVLSAPTPLPGEARALLRSELAELDGSIGRALARASGREMQAHLKDCRYQISRILYPEKK